MLFYNYGMRPIILQSTPYEALQSLARFIKAVRLNQEMTLDELASRSGTSRSTLTRLESQGTGSIETQMKVLAALGVLDQILSSFASPEKQLTIDELKKMSSGHQRKRGRRRTRVIP